MKGEDFAKFCGLLRIYRKVTSSNMSHLKDMMAFQIALKGILRGF